MQESESAPQEPEKPGETGMEAEDSETYTNCVSLKEKSIETGAESPEEQLPGQIGIEEAIEEAEERNAAGPYIELDNSAMAAGVESDKELDAEWEKRKDTIDMYAQAMTAEGTTMSKNLSLLPARELRILREELIGMAALIEKELLRRGEEF